LVKILQQANVTVHRPKDLDFVGYDGMYNYCPRDRLLIAGNCIIDPVMMYPARDIELAALGCVIQRNELVTMPRHWGMVLDAANICRLDDTWLFLESSSGNRAAAVWLQARFPEIQIELCNFYAGVHIDSTVVPLREGVVMLNASRLTLDTVPKCLRSWTQIWIDDCVPQQFHQYPYASKWIGMNTLSIDPSTVIVDAAQTDVIKRLEAMKFTVIPHTLRHSRTLGGGFHCVTLDTWRQND
jgi:N-dimethylarginine dimethylaminohydrolase